MGAIRRIGSWLVYPMSRAASDVRGSYARVSGMVEEYRQQRQDRRTDGEVVAEFLHDAPGAREKFQRMVEVGQWTDEDLKRQSVAVRRTRLGMLGVALLSLVIALVSVWILSTWAVALIGTGLVVVAAMAAAQALRMAWYEADLEARALTPFRNFLGRDDLFARLFRMGA